MQTCVEIGGGGRKHGEYGGEGGRRRRLREWQRAHVDTLRVEDGARVNALRVEEEQAAVEETG